ncbi:MAG: dihydrodipicolinate synthase family protein [Planctomycetes bacterium]|nr:dihydrodipicolinate synthase family protein [Planctomycetota bacterium]
MTGLAAVPVAAGAALGPRDLDFLDGPERRLLEGDGERGPEVAALAGARARGRAAEERVVELSPARFELAAGRGVVITSVGAESTEQARTFARQAEEAGCDAMMAVPPISTALSGTEVAGYFQALAEEVAGLVAGGAIE